MPVTAPQKRAHRLLFHFLIFFVPVEPVIQRVEGFDLKEIFTDDFCQSLGAGWQKAA